MALLYIRDFVDDDTEVREVSDYGRAWVLAKESGLLYQRIDYQETGQGRVRDAVSRWPMARLALGYHHKYLWVGSGRAEMQIAEGMSRAGRGE